MIVVVAYDRHQAETVLLTWTSHRLLDEALDGTFHQLGETQAEAVESVALAWVQRAMGDLMLRDALLIDPVRGAIVWAGLCAWLASERCVLPPEEVPSTLLDASAGDHVLDVATAREIVPAQSRLAALLAIADSELALAIWTTDPVPRAPLPTQLDRLLPPSPRPLPPVVPQFEQPTGFRRTLATVLALVGTGLVGLPLLIGQTPIEPARLPLALITLALLVGIKARPMGYLGSLCIWLVANLPGFHHGNLLTLWPAIPLLVVGLLLLIMDVNIRAMWRWLRSKVM